MIPFEYVDILGNLVVIFAISSGVLRLRKLSLPEKIVLGLIMLSLLVERVATYCIIKIRNSNVVYGAFSPIEVFIIALYFHYSVDVFKKSNVALYIGLSALIFGFVNYFWIQSPFKMNNFFLLLESLIVITLCLYSFYRMLLADDNLVLTKYSHFWITSIFLFFWTATFFIWGLYDYIIVAASAGVGLVNDLLLVVNILTYLAFGFVFLFHKKMQLIDG